MSRPSIAIPTDTQDKQRRAADPAHSAWVSANAGSGKTFVLTRRVVRLLLQGTRPRAILCLTFTKAAAANMAIKVFETLAQWVTLDDTALAAAIVETGAPAPGPAELDAARRLFARTVETPGGLRILTIHAFCETLLHAFPFEANVAAGFTVIEELRRADLLARAREVVLEQAIADPDDALGAAMTRLSGSVSPGEFGTLIESVAAEGSALRETIRTPEDRAAVARALADALGTDGRSVEAIDAAILEEGLPVSEWVSMAQTIEHAAGGQHNLADRLFAAAAAPPDERLDAYLDVTLTQVRSPRATLVSRSLVNAEPLLCGRLLAEQARLVALLEQRRIAATHERTVALLTIAGAVLDRYEMAKRHAGLLDFDDLIARTRELLSRSDSAWVLYKLDAGIDHVLVDEAQDTSPDQWAILEAITRDFFSGQGASEARRTVFAVGDEKQSIFSFQGARPAMMQAVSDGMARRAEGAERPFVRVDLLLSFRSAGIVLDMVDRVFAHGDNARGLSAALERPRPHQALKAKLPGLVEVWPVVVPAPVAEPVDWRLPLDVEDVSAPAAIVAGRVADAIKRMVAPGSGETVEGADGVRRPVQPGDVMILVRARNAVFDGVIRALKERGVPVAGADRLALTEHIATMDLVAAGRAALLPDDDLTLACLLKSPLVGLDDDDLIRLAPGRLTTLEAALRASDEPRHRVAANRLAIWRDRAATLSPFGFYTRLLGADGGRHAMLARLGPEAADVMDEFLALTLAHERDGPPSLLGFLAELEGNSLTIKRDLESATDAVRVMTVHAAKGLESKIVFLPDTCGAPNGKHDPKLFKLEDGSPLVAWSPRMDTDPPPVLLRREAERAAALDEHRRLLYVALTRAEERLYVAGFQGRNTRSPDCWHDMIMASGLGLDPVPAPWNPEELVLRRSDPVPAAPAPAPAPAAPPVVLPAFLRRPAPQEAPAVPPIRPSHALAAADAPDRADTSDEAPLGARRAAALTGRLTHRLLQHLPTLPPARRREAALRFLTRHGPALGADARDRLVADVLAVLDRPELAALFGEGSRAEVAVAARLIRPNAPPLGVVGQIDRLGQTASTVTIADFKSGRPRPAAETPPAYVAQLALYRAAVAPLFPGRDVEALIVWTAGPLVVRLDDAVLAAALATALESDMPPAG